MYKRIFSYMKEYWLRYVLALVLMGLIVLLDILNPYFMGLSLKELGKETIDFSLVLSYFFRCLILIILLNVMQFCQTIFPKKFDFFEK